AAHLGWMNLYASPLAFMGSAWAVGIFTSLALIELVTDQLPKTPARTTASRASQLLTMRIQNVMPDYVREIRQLYPSVSNEQLINMQVQHITPKFAREIRQIYPAASVRDLINMQVQRVTPEFAREMLQVHPSTSIRDLIDMKVQDLERSSR